MERRKGSIDRAQFYFVAGFLVLVVIGIALSPLGLTWLSGRSVDWALLSDVGQAYGGASAILSGLAFCGIAISLLLQWRQFRSSLLYSVKQRHFELVKLALDNPEYLYVDGDDVANDPDGKLKVYGNLLVNHWAMTWDMGFMSASSLQQSARRLFRSALALDWWLQWGGSYLGGRGRQHFVQILDAEALAARSGRRPALRSVSTALTEGGQKPSRTSRPKTIMVTSCAVGAGVIGAAVCVSLIRRQKSAFPGR